MQSFLTRCKRNPHDVALFGLCQIGIILVTKRIINEINLLTEQNSAGNLLRFEWLILIGQALEPIREDVSKNHSISKFLKLFLFYIIFNILSSLWKLALSDTTDRGIIYTDENIRLGWELCWSCESHRPNRAYHCPECRACALRRDHHCNFAVNCVGFTNARYFYTFLIWLTIGKCSRNGPKRHRNPHKTPFRFFICEYYKHGFPCSVSCKNINQIFDFILCPIGCMGARNSWRRFLWCNIIDDITFCSCHFDFLFKSMWPQMTCFNHFWRCISMLWKMEEQDMRLISMRERIIGSHWSQI